MDKAYLNFHKVDEEVENEYFSNHERSIGNDKISIINLNSDSVY